MKTRSGGASDGDERRDPAQRALLLREQADLDELRLDVAVDRVGALALAPVGEVEPGR